MKIMLISDLALFEGTASVGHLYSALVPMLSLARLTSHEN